MHNYCFCQVKGRKVYTYIVISDCLVIVVFRKLSVCIYGHPALMFCRLLMKFGIIISVNTWMVL